MTQPRRSTLRLAAKLRDWISQLADRTVFFGARKRRYTHEASCEMVYDTSAIAGVKLVRWVEQRNSKALIAGIEAIFFAAAARQTFASARERDSFRERWLGRYLLHFPEHVTVALDRHGNVVGYIVGAHTDPAQHRLFSDISYFQDFAAVTKLFPAHLHINVAHEYRSLGIGRGLVELFCDAARVARLSGVHVVTGKATRNVAFYERAGFVCRACTFWNRNEIVLLGRNLGPDLQTPSSTR
jgi:GNAT superfamily N-acetyltransferase